MELKKVGTNCLKMGMDLLFPRHCPVCDEIVKPFGQLICEKCERELRTLSEVVCQKCGKALKDEAMIYCSDCKNKHHDYTQGRTVFAYESVKQSIYRFKYMGRAEYAEYYGEIICQKLKKQIQLWNPDVMIPVPLHKSRLSQRGYNQTELIAKVVGKKLQIPVETKWIRRCKKTIPQKELDPLSRQNNLKKAFKIVPNDVKLETIVIIDDIYTTGSTIDAMSMVLKSVGVKKIYFLTVAIGSDG